MRNKNILIVSIALAFVFLTAIKFILVIVSFSLLSCNRSASIDDKNEETQKKELFSMEKAIALDEELAEAFDDFWGNWESYESTYMKAQAFKSKLKHALVNEPKTIFYPFEKLSERISIVQTPFSNIKFYSWNNLSGGSWQKMTTFVQFISGPDKILFKRLDSDEKRDNDEYIDAVIYAIHHVAIIDRNSYRSPGNPNLYFVTFGSGSQGGGSHFKVIQIFRIEGDEFHFCETCFDGARYYIHRTHRLNEIELEIINDNIHIREIDRRSGKLAYSVLLKLEVDRYRVIRGYNQ